MRKQEFGIIVNMSSGAGMVGYPGGSAYVSTKFPVEGLSEPMAYELEPFGIKVVLVEPGVIRTHFALALPRNLKVLFSIFADNVKKTHMVENGSSPDLVAKVVLKAVASENPSLRWMGGKGIET